MCVVWYGVVFGTALPQIPMGFDDLSAAVVFDLQPDQDLPLMPPAPASKLCPCPAVPDSTGACPDGTALANVNRQDKLGGTAQQCIPLPSYDLVQQQFAFSMCWVWSCLPQDFRTPNSPGQTGTSNAAKVKPYTVSILGITQYNINLIPGGMNRFNFLKPNAVNMSIVFNGDSPVGPFTATGDGMTPMNPTSVDITVSVPGVFHHDTKQPYPPTNT
jgi:hypothetical protein